METTVRNLSGLTRHEQMLENEKKPDAEYKEEWDLYFAKKSHELGEFKVCTQHSLPKRFKTAKDALSYFNESDGRATILFQDKLIKHKQA